MQKQGGGGVDECLDAALNPDIEIKIDQDVNQAVILHYVYGEPPDSPCTWWAIAVS